MDYGCGVLEHKCLNGFKLEAENVLRQGHIIRKCINNTYTERGGLSHTYFCYCDSSSHFGNILSLLVLHTYVTFHRELTGLVQRNIKADWVFELWGLYSCWEEDSPAHTGSCWGEQDNDISPWSYISTLKLQWWLEIWEGFYLRHWIG